MVKRSTVDDRESDSKVEESRLNDIIGEGNIRTDGLSKKSFIGPNSKSLKH